MTRCRLSSFPVDLAIGFGPGLMLIKNLLEEVNVFMCCVSGTNDVMRVVTFNYN